MTFERLMQILEEEIVGDGQGYPNNNERERAARRILAELAGADGENLGNGH